MDDEPQRPETIIVTPVGADLVQQLDVEALAGSPTRSVRIIDENTEESAVLTAEMRAVLTQMAALTSGVTPFAIRFEPTVSLAEAARHLGVDEAEVEALVEQGQITAVERPAERRFHLERVDPLAQYRCNQRPEPPGPA